MFTRGKTAWSAVVGVLLLLGGRFPAVAASSSAGKVDFSRDILPVLSDKCFFCHGPDEKARKAKLRLDTEAGALQALKDGTTAVVRSKPDKSELVARIFSKDPDDVMPPPDSHRTLTDEQRQLFKRWVEQGAPWGKHWSFTEIGRVTPPKVKDTRWAANEIDRFVLARIEERKLAPAPVAPREQLIRRVAFDLTGLPPTLAEIDAYLADRSPNAYEKMVDRYLSAPAYGERMANDWLDLARYADTYGYQADVDRDMSPWRDWVIRSFNENLPYDQFITWQLAGDLLPHATRDQRLATAFNRLHRQTNEGGSIEEEFRVEYVSDRVHTMGTAFLGLTLECCRCHDHKYDPISQRDYYSLTAFFNNIDESGLYSHFTHATPTPALPLYTADQEAKENQLQAKIATDEQTLKTLRQSATERFHAWQSAPDAAKLPLPQPVAAFAFDETMEGKTPNAQGTNAAVLVDAPKLVPGHAGQAIQFSGDNSVICKGVGHFRRTEPFSLSLWLRPQELQARAVVLHYSRAWTDSGSRGYELVLEDGRPFFGLIHFWPGNAIAVRAKQPLPLKEWSQMTVTYDGSSRAEGIALYVNGQRLESEVVRDHLTRDILHLKEWGDADVDDIHLTLGGRFRDSGFKGGEVDDLKVFNACLTAREAALLAGQSAVAPSLDDYLARVDESYRQALATLQSARAAENDLADSVPEIMVMQELPQHRTTYLLKRGSYDAHGDEVQPGTPERIFPFPAEYPKNRLGLAKWMTDSRNPLPARVVVNRIWKMHFGQGLVPTVEDFGAQGRRPTHPELLDWLAKRFIDSGWDVKALHKLILLSSTYRQSSVPTPEVAAADPDDQLLARGPRHRLSAEQIRDAALMVSGLLNRQIGGPSVKPYQPAGLWEESGTGKTYVQDKGDKLYRRSLYTFWRRTAPPPSMLSFDATSREVCTAKREVTATPLQSLVLLNDPQFVEAQRVLGERLVRDEPANATARITTAFRELTARHPDADEQKILTQLLDEQRQYFAGKPEAAEKLLATGERPRDKSLPAVEVAATSVLVSALMNYDEFVMER